MFSFVACFIFGLVWIFILMQLIGIILLVNKKIKVQIISFFFLILSLLLAFLLSVVSFYFVLDILATLPDYLAKEIRKQDFEVIIPPRDCLPLLKAIEQTESQINKPNNHRYIEETAHLFTIKLEYQKAARKLASQAKIYHNLALSPEADKYAQQIATKLKEQADLFAERNTITTNKEGIKKVYKLLNKMDKVEQEKLRSIDRVKQQCNNTA